MTFPHLPYGQMVTVRNRSVNGKDEFGNDKYGYTESVVGPCAIQQASSQEAIRATEQVATSMIVFMPFGTKINYLDSVIINGDEYEVTAEPESWSSPFSGHTSPVRVLCTLTKGASV